MNSLEIPINVKVKINGKGGKLYPCGKFTLSTKKTIPNCILLLYASFKLLIEAFKEVIK